MNEINDMNLKIRPLKQSDLDQLIRLYEHMFDEPDIPAPDRKTVHRT